MDYNKSIESFLQKRNIKNDKKLINIIKKISSLDMAINKDIKNNKNSKMCIAYAQNPLLCLSRGKDKVVKSHVVPENQIFKFIQKHGNIYSFSFQIFNKINNITSKSSTSSPDFIGFCESCEKSFTQESKINIDSEINFHKEHLLKSIYRYLGKEITYRESYLKNALLIIDNNSEIINNQDFEYFNVQFNNYNNDFFIINQTHYLKNIQNLFFDLGINSFLPKINISKDVPEVFSFKKIKISNKYEIIGQSFSQIPLYFQDYRTYFPIFFQIVYDDKNKCSYFYFLTSSQIFSFIENIESKLTTDQRELFYITLALLHSSEFYFTDSFFNDFYPLIEDIIIKTSLKQQSSFLDEVQELFNIIKLT